eukprot:jgi/Psemu1/25549/gm1.25549_g
MQKIDEHFGEGNEVYLSGVFKHLQGSNFKYHKLLDFETWECFGDSKADLQNFKNSQTNLYAAGWVMFTSKRDTVPPPHDDGGDKAQDNVNKSEHGNNKDGDLDNKGDNVSDPRQDKGNKSDKGNDKDGTLDNSSDNVSDLRQEKGNKSDEGNDKDGTLDNNNGNVSGDNVSDPRQGKGNKSDEGNRKDRTSYNDGNLKPKAKPTTLESAK